MQNNTTGVNNTAVGQNALATNTTGYNNAVVGGRAAAFGSPHDVAAVGLDAASRTNNAAYIAAVGTDALYNAYNSMYAVAIGDSTLWKDSVGVKNTAVGSRAGYYLGDTYPNFSTQHDNYMTFLGADASRDSSISNQTGLTNSTAIGYNAKVYASNQVSIGNSNTTTTLLRGNVGIGTNTPSALLQAASGNCDFRFSKGLADVTPSMTVINTSGMAGGLIAGTGGSAFVYDNAGPFYLISESHSAFVNNTLGGGTVRMTLTATGELGINTTSPAEKLEVAGNAKVSGKFIGRNIIYRTLNASDADFTAAVGTAYVLPDAATTARTVTLPAGQDGDIIRFHLPLTPSNHWTFSTAVTLPDGSTYTNIDTYTNSVTTIQYDGANSVWRAVVNL
jgi:hypothetical protein